MNDNFKDDNQSNQDSFSNFFSDNHLDSDPVFTAEGSVSSEKTQDTEEELKKKKRRKYLLIGLGVVAFLAVAVYIWGVFYYSNHFFPRTEINGINVSLQDLEQARESINADISNRELILQGDGGLSDTITSSQIDLSFDNKFGDLEKLLDDQNPYFWEVHSLTKDEVEMHTHYYYDEFKLADLVNSLSVVSGPGVTPPQNAKISYNGNEFIIDPSIEGNQPNIDKLSEAILKGLVENEKLLKLNELNIYNHPELTVDSESLKNEVNTLNSKLGAVITINFPGQQVTLDKTTFGPWLGVENNQATVNDDELNAYVGQLAQQFSNRNKEVTFKAVNGRTYSYIYNGGWELNQAAEASQIKDSILAGKSVTLNAVWAQQGSNYLTGTAVVGNYIEISLAEQTLRFYKNNSLISTSTIVSGNVGSRQSTQTGLYFLESKDTNVNILVRQSDGNMLNQQVAYWLPYSQNYGIASATWRTDFGGNIYQNQGTDGDVDVPTETARTIFNNADVGFPVVIY